MTQILRTLLIAILVGCSCQVAFYYLRDLELIGQIDSSDATTDLLMRNGWNSGVGPQEKMTPPITIIDFNQNAFALAKWPRIVSRQAIATALDAAILGHARLFVIDVDVSWPSPKDEHSELIAALARASQAKLPVLIIREPVSTGDPVHGPYLLPASVLDEVIKDGTTIRYASASFPRESDDVVRRIVPLVQTCRDRVATPLLSVHIWANAIISSGDAAENMHRIDKSLATVGKCEPAIRAVSAISLPIRGHPTLWGIGRDETRIMFRTLDNTGRALRVLPGSAFLSPLERIDSSLLNGRIVIFGSSSAIARDQHLTPLGESFGAAILANAIHQSVSGNKLQSAGVEVTIAISAFASIVTWLLWYLTAHVRKLHPEVASELVKLATLCVWIVGATIAFGASAIVAFAAPQYIVFLILTLIPDGI